MEDDWVFDVQRRLAQEEGLFSEPAGAVGVAGALQAVRNGDIKSDDRVVCLITGLGFKDPDSVDKMLDGREAPMYDLSQLLAEME